MIYTLKKTTQLPCVILTQLTQAMQDKYVSKYATDSADI